MRRRHWNLGLRLGNHRMAKKVLIDECLPRQLKSWLGSAYQCQTAQEAGLSGVKNGQLLRRANESGVDVFVTADKNMYYQQNFTGLNISAVVIPSNKKLMVQKSVSALKQSIDVVKPGQKVVMDLGANHEEWPSLELSDVSDGDDFVTHIFSPK